MKSKRNRLKIRGSGGDDPPPQHIPTESNDSLGSHAYIRILDLLSEGEIVGLVNGAQSIYLDDTPVQNADGTYNFSQLGFQYDTRTGTQAQTYMRGVSSVENEISVGVEVKQGLPIVRTVSSTTVNRLKVRILFPQLTSTDPTTGDIGGASASISIDVQPNGGAYTAVYSKTVTGKASSRYELTASIPLAGTGPWNVRVTRNTANSVSTYLQNKTIWESYTEVVDAKLSYPNSALIALRLDAQSFQNVPRRSYDLKLLKIKIPSNYNPTTRVYTGTWDGTWQVGWTDNPAWIFYDLATNSRYGLGAFIPAAQVDRWQLYSVAQYCDGMVPDGFGGTEPRFRCNLLIPDRGEAYTVMQSLASVFRGMIYWAAGSVTVSQDSPADATNLYTPANVVDGRFHYQGAASKARHSVALVTWNDPADFYKPKIEYVEDQDAIAKFGVEQVEVVAFGCTSRGQANRFGRWILYTEQYESDAVSFKTGLEGIVGRPGQIIKIADPTRAGARMGGRVVSATTTTVTVDADIVGSISGNTLSVLLPTGVIEDRGVVGSSSVRTIQVSPAFSMAPNAQSVWVLKSATINPQTYKVVGVKENEDGTYDISAIKHDPSKYDAIENNVALETKSYSNLTSVTAAPQNIVITESLYQSALEVRAKVTVSWDRAERASSYIVRYQKDSNNWVELPETVFSDQDILDVQPGIFTVQVSAINPVGKRSAVTTATKEILGKTALPLSVDGFSMVPNAGSAYLTWNQSIDLDVIVGGQVRIRHTPLTTGQTWRNAVDIIPAIPGSSTSALAPLLSGTYMAKFVDSSGNYSSAETMIVTTVPTGLALNVVNTQTEDTAFLGTKTNMTIDTSSSALVLSSLTLFDSYGLIDSTSNWDFPGGISQTGTYDFQNTVDLGGVWPSNITSYVNLQAFDIGNLIDSRLDLIDTWPDIDGSFIDDVNAELYVRTTLDNPSLAPTWTDWKRFRTANYEARGFQFQLRCTSGTQTHNLYIKNLSVTLHLDDRTLHLGPITSGTGTTYRVNYGQAFFAVPAISITANNMQSGDFQTITNADATGFDIVFKNSSGTIVSRDFSVITKGYGRKTA